MDALSLVEPEGRRGEYDWFKVDPGIMYPHSLLDLVESGRVTVAAAQLAITPRDSVGSEEDVKLRANTLSLARVNFLKRLIAQHGVGVGLHILNIDKERWRL